MTIQSWTPDRSVARNVPRGGGAHQWENVSALKIIFQSCTPLQPFFLQGACPGTLCTLPGSKYHNKVDTEMYYIYQWLRSIGTAVSPLVYTE